MNTTVTDTRERDDVLREIEECEARLLELRSIIPSPFKKLFKFRCRPGNQKIWIYAKNRAEAEDKLNQKMNQSYGPEGWQISSSVVDEFDHPEKAAGLSDGNLLHCLTHEDADELYRDFESDLKGRSPNNHNRAKDLKTRLERDIEGYNRRNRGV